jgi:hypothetical protein
MKKICLTSITVILFFAACENSGSSTVGSYDTEDSSESSVTNENISKGQSSNNETDNTKMVSVDTAKNTTGISKDSVSSKNRKDSGPLLDKQNVKVQKTKKIQVKP